jgi:hypothetical protein
MGEAGPVGDARTHGCCETKPVNDPLTLAGLGHTGARRRHIKAPPMFCGLTDGHSEPSGRRIVDFHGDGVAFPATSRCGTSRVRRG